LHVSLSSVFVGADYFGRRNILTHEALESSNS